MVLIGLYVRIIFSSCLLSFFIFRYRKRSLFLFDPQKVVKHIGVKRSKSRSHREKAQIIKCVRSVCKRNPFCRITPCLHRSLLLYRFLQMYGYSPTLNIGFVITRFSQKKEETTIDNVHAWVMVNGQVILDDKEYCISQYPYSLCSISNIHYWTGVEVAVKHP